MEDKKREIGGPGWALIPPAIMMTTELTPREKLIWGRINGLINVRGYCWASNEMLAEQIQVKTNTMSDIISDMVESGYMKRKLVYRKGKVEFIYDEKPSDEELKGKKYIERRLVPMIPESRGPEDEIDGEPYPVEKGRVPGEKRDKEFEMSIRQKKEKKNGTKEKKENEDLKADCGYAAPPLTESKDSITDPSNAKEEPLREYGQESRVIKSYQDMPGTRFGDIIVLGSFEKVGDGKWDWIGLCPCGRKGVYSNEELLGEKPKVCICKLNAIEIMQRELDMFEEMRKPFNERPGYISEIREGKSKRTPNRKNSASIRTWTEEDREWKKLVHERDNCTCQKCGNIEKEKEFYEEQLNGKTVHYISPAIKIIAHHIDGYKENVELRLEIDNGVTLCNDCHNKFHGIYGKGNNTREQFAKFMKDDSKDKKEQE